MVLERFKRMWVGWNRGVRRVMTAQTAILMAVAYVLAIGPVALVLRLLGRSMLDRKPADPAARTFWSKRTGRPLTMEEAARRW